MPSSHSGHGREKMSKQNSCVENGTSLSFPSFIRRKQTVFFVVVQKTGLHNRHVVGKKGK